MKSTTTFPDGATALPASTADLAASAANPEIPGPVSADGPPDSSPLARCFPRSQSETPRALSAFHAYFQLGHGRTLQAVADLLGENFDTVRRWSSRHQWSHRIQSFQSGLLQQQAEAEAARRSRQAENLADRTAEVRELEWAAARKLSTAALCYLENIGDREIECMNLGQASRALRAASLLARLSVSDDNDPREQPLSPIQIELAAALKQAYSQPISPEPPVPGPAEGTAVTARN